MITSIYTTVMVTILFYIVYKRRFTLCTTPSKSVPIAPPINGFITTNLISVTKLLRKNKTRFYIVNQMHDDENQIVLCYWSLVQ